MFPSASLTSAISFPHRHDAGAVWAPGGRPRIVFGFTITRGKIVAIDLVADPERLRQLDLVVLGD